MMIWHSGNESDSASRAALPDPVGMIGWRSTAWSTPASRRRGSSAVGAGAYKNIQEACDATIQVTSETAVNRKAAAVYDRGFSVYQGLYQSLKDDFRRIAELTAA
mgnify:CR=1 FL=1